LARENAVSGLDDFWDSAPKRNHFGADDIPQFTHFGAEKTPSALIHPSGSGKITKSQ
jgi:hypothetical protein